MRLPVLIWLREATRAGAEHLRAWFVAQELLRTCVPGGIIAMANWTAAGFVGQMFKSVTRFIAPADSVTAPRGATSL